MQDTSVSFGYQLDVPKANLLFKGTACIQFYLKEKHVHYRSDNPAQGAVFTTVFTFVASYSLL